MQEASVGSKVLFKLATVQAYHFAAVPVKAGATA
jgi:hypothetical protein